MLIYISADLNQKDANGKTALMISRRKDILKRLVEEGADVNLTDNEGMSALDHSFRMCGAKNSNTLYIVLILLEQLFLYLFQSEPTHIRLDIETYINGNVDN